MDDDEVMKIEAQYVIFEDAIDASAGEILIDAYARLVHSIVRETARQNAVEITGRRRLVMALETEVLPE